MNDAKLKSLILALDQFDDLNTPDCKGLFLNAQAHDYFKDYKNLQFEQGLKPQYDILRSYGFSVTSLSTEETDSNTSLTNSFDYVLSIPSRQRSAARATLARSVLYVKKEGLVLTATSNLEGAKTLENDMKSLFGIVGNVSKYKCRALWARRTDRFNETLAHEWIAEDAPQRNESGLWSRTGLFSWQRNDQGSLKLLSALPPLKGIGCDLGCGYATLMVDILQKNKDITRFYGYEADIRAVEMAKRNLLEYTEKTSIIWADVQNDVTGTYDFIVSNPPFHTDRADNPALGQAFIATAAQYLRKNGTFYMVANRHLPYEDSLKSHFKRVTLLDESQGFKVYQAVKG